MKVRKFAEEKIILGDVISVLDDCVKDGSIDLIFADPPYNIGKKFNGKQKKWDSDVVGTLHATSVHKMVLSMARFMYQKIKKYRQYLHYGSNTIYAIYRYSFKR